VGYPQWSNGKVFNWVAIGAIMFVGGGGCVMAIGGLGCNYVMRGVCHNNGLFLRSRPGAKNTPEVGGIGGGYK